MSDGKPVRLRVVDEGGGAVEGALVSVLRSTVAFPEIALVTDRNGTVQLSLPAGTFVIGAHASGGRYGEVELDSSLDDLRQDIVLTLRPAR